MTDPRTPEMPDVWCRYCKRWSGSHDDECYCLTRDRDSTSGTWLPRDSYATYPVKDQWPAAPWKCEPRLTLIGRIRSFLGLSIGGTDA